MENMYSEHNIKELRQRKGFSQEELAELTGLNLRTIQRIENGETDPRGDSLKRIAAALGVPPGEIIDWTMRENNHYLRTMNLSALTSLIFPLLGIIVPYILWSHKRDSVKGVDGLGKEIVNFQITWNIIVFALLILLRPILSFLSFVFSDGYITPFGGGLMSIFIYWYAALAYNLIMILINQLRLGIGKRVRYFPRIKFMK